MIPEIVLQRACGSAGLNRARSIVSRGLVFDRGCQYHRSHTLLDGRVRCDSVSGLSYTVHATVDEDRGELVDYGCTCPAASNLGTPCKHVIALVLDFNRFPTAYAGYSAARYVTTTGCVADLIDRALMAPAVADDVEEDEDEPDGAVSLELTLVRDDGYWDARFRVVGSRGGYVLKDIQAFTERFARGERYRYGKSLAFAHVPQAFTERGYRVARFLRRAVSARVAGAGGSARWSYGAQRVGRELHLSRVELADLLDLYDGEPFMFEDVTDGGSRPRRMRLVDGDPRVGVGVRELADGGCEITRAGDVRFVDGDGTLFAWDDHAFYRCTSRLAPARDFLCGVYGSPAAQLVVSEKDLPRFAATILPQLEDVLGAQVPAGLRAMRPRPCRVSFRLDRDRRGVTASVRATYGDVAHELLSERRQPAADTGRDLVAEGQALRVLGRYFPGVADGSGVGEDGLALIPARDEDAVARLVYEGTADLARYGEVLATPAFERLASGRRPRAAVGLSVRGDLLELSVRASDLPQDELYALLASYRARRRYHRLRDGSFVRLADADLAGVDRVASQLDLTARQLGQGDVELPAYEAFALDQVADPAERDVSFDDYLRRFRSVDADAYEPPAQLADVLRPYQVTGYRWLSALTDMGLGGILADEMGLGKSVQLISLLLARREEAREVGPSLIVCPASLVYNWVAEFARFAPAMRVAAVAGSRTEREAIRDDARNEVLVTSYELLRRDIRDYEAMSFWSETLDEAQYVKNHTTLAARSVRKVRARHRFALTGTPVENRLSELWSIFDFLMPGILGTYASFRARYEQPILAQEEGAAERLRAVIRPFVLRRLKSEVLTDLPEKSETVVLARLEGEQRRLYDAHEQELRLSLTDQDDAAFTSGKLAVLAELMRLRQICCDPGLLYEDYKGPSAKLDAIMDLIQAARDSGQKSLVFSQFTSYLDLIVARLDAAGVPYFRIVGATPKQTRLDLVNRFNADDTPVFLVSLKAGGTGLNLTGASVVIHADPWWNAAAQNQATDRAHRIGQTRSVSVYKVIAKGTIEERIVQLQAAKSDLADSVMGVENASIASLTKQDLIDLLGDADA